MTAVRRFLESPLQGSARFVAGLVDRAEPSEDELLSREDELFHTGPLARASLLGDAFRRGGNETSYDALALRLEQRGARPSGAFGEAERGHHLEILAAWRAALSHLSGRDSFAFEEFRRDSVLVDGIRIENRTESLLRLSSPRMSVRLCSQSPERFDPRRESLRGFLEHVFESACGAVLGEPHTLVVINAVTGAEPNR